MCEVIYLYDGTFEGFLPVNKKSRRERLDALNGEQRTMIFHEAPHKLSGTLDDLCAAFGPDRNIALCREMTKLHEETVRTTLGAAAAHYRENTPRGEYVLVVAGAAPEMREAEASLADGAAAALDLYRGGLRLKDAVRQVSEQTGLNKRELYAAALAMQEGEPS